MSTHAHEALMAALLESRAVREIESARAERDELRTVVEEALAYLTPDNPEDDGPCEAARRHLERALRGAV